MAGLVLVLTAALYDPLCGQPFELSVGQLAGIVIGELVALSALAYGRPRLRRALVVSTALFGVTYGALLGLELALGLVAPPRATLNSVVALRGLNVEDPQVGFRLAAGWHGRYDDGVVAADYDTNARGDRDDDEPLPGAARRVLLLGDSFTFGQALPRAATIEAGIEAGSRGEVDAYNLGVPGYATLHSLRRFEQSAWWRGDDVVYFFFNNDVHASSRALDYMKVVDGYAVSRRAPDGHEYDDAELRARLSSALSSEGQGARAWLAARMGLHGLRRVLACVLDPELRRTGLPETAFEPRAVDEAVASVMAMAALATERGATLHVVVIPTPVEAAEGEWSRSTGAFIRAVEAAGLAPHEELLARLDASDYLAHDGHFSADGARVAAALVLELLRQAVA